MLLMAIFFVGAPSHDFLIIWMHVWLLSCQSRRQLSHFLSFLSKPTISVFVQKDRDLPISPYLISKARPYSGRNTFIQIGIRKDNSRIFASKLQWELLTIWRTPFHDALASECASREGNERHFRMRNKSIPSFWTTPKDDIDNTWRNPLQVQTCKIQCSAGILSSL